MPAPWQPLSGFTMNGVSAAPSRSQNARSRFSCAGQLLPTHQVCGVKVPKCSGWSRVHTSSSCARQTLRHTRTIA